MKLTERKIWFTKEGCQYLYKEGCQYFYKEGVSISTKTDVSISTKWDASISTKRDVSISTKKLQLKCIYYNAVLHKQSVLNIQKFLRFRLRTQRPV
jgi:hypothetical protein